MHLEEKAWDGNLLRMKASSFHLRCWSIAYLFVLFNPIFQLHVPYRAISFRDSLVWMMRFRTDISVQGLMLRLPLLMI